MSDVAASQSAVPPIGHGRVIELDVLRAIAVVLVMGRHWLPDFTGVPAPLAAALELWRRGGWVGVDLFFVLSGFLVSGLLFRELEKYGSIHPARFLLRRGLKIYPAFYVFLAITLPICLHYRPAAVSGQSVVGELLFVQNYLSGVWNHTWSLAVEEHFYLVVPWIILWLSRRRETLVRNLALLSGGVAVLCLLLRLHWLHSIGDPGINIPTGTHYRIDALMFGVLLSALFHRNQPRFATFVRANRYALAVVGAALILPAFAWDFRTHFWLKTFGYDLMFLGSGCWVSLAAVCKLSNAKPVRVCAYLGAHSYSTYLWHMPLAWAFSIVGARLAGHPISGWWAFLYVAVAFAVGIIAAKIVELPVLHLRDRWFPSRINPMSTPSGATTHLANAVAT